ncbi:MAG: hypothetical protein GEU86_10365 [Actinophytocola sp.]|nr:hypothetical protein [Actinophytocola sp.]
MPRPFSAYLRVYEPLSAFGDPLDKRLLAAVEAATLTRATAGEREEQMWLKSQVSTPPRLLPAELADGRAAPSGTTDVLVLQPADVPTGKGVKVGPGPLVCPLELRARSAAALVSFLGDAHPALRNAVLDVNGTSMESIRARAAAALGELHTDALHVLSVTWTIPLPWFTLVDPGERRLVLGTGLADPERELSWRVAMIDARRRVAQARELAENVIGDEGPTKILIDTDHWLAAFHPNSAVELDYGGLVQMIEDPILESDTSAEEVHAVLDALRSGDIEELTDLFTGLRDYWGELAARERFN